MKHIKLWEDWDPELEWSWPEWARLLELGLTEPDLFQTYIKIPFVDEVLDKDWTRAELEALAAQFGVQCQGGHNAGPFVKKRLEFLWVGPVQGLKAFATEVIERFPPEGRVGFRNWTRLKEDMDRHDIEEWWRWFRKNRELA